MKMYYYYPSSPKWHKHRFVKFAVAFIRN